jgi:hypothetical protein
MKKKVLIACIGLVVLVSIILLIYMPLRQAANLHSLENEVANISLPQNIEMIAIRSAVGDSGGNGNYSTLRVVLAVKTVLSINELKTEFENLNLRFPKHYKNSDNRPIFYITHCEDSTFRSSRDFSLSIEELEIAIDYSKYYFIEFVE